MTFGLRNRITKFTSRIKPKPNRLVRGGKGDILRVAMRHTSRKLRDFCHKYFILITPIDNDLDLYIGLAAQAIFQNDSTNLASFCRVGIAPKDEGNISWSNLGGRLKPAGVSRFLLICSNSVTLHTMPRVLHPHIVSDSHLCGGSPRIEGSRIPVRTIVVYVLHHGTTPESLLGYYPQLSLAAIYDALSYYYDNREEIDAEIAANAALEPSAPSLS